MVHYLRAEKVILDADLAELYGVATKVLNQAVLRNIARFPGDFMFQLTEPEAGSLRSQSVTLKRGQHRKYPTHLLPCAATARDRVSHPIILSLTATLKSVIP